MKINIQKLVSLSLAIGMLLCISACGASPELELPPLPTYSDESPLPAQTDVPSPEPSKTPATPTVGPSATAVPAATSTPVPTPLPTVETDVPVLSISEATYPEDMVQLNVASLRGVVSTDKGNITKVSAALVDSDGNEVQSCYYQPVLPSFSLAGTVNAQLQFAMLQPGSYTYVLHAEAENNGISVQRQLIDHQFTVYSSAEEMRNSSTGGEEAYGDKISIDSENAAVIWNFLIVYLDNPYGAAGVLANIEVESGCDPRRVQGDFSEGFIYSENYTKLVDEGNVNRDSFIWALPDENHGSGYGLCQWTLDRKEGLYDLAMKDGKSIADLNTQCTYLIMELEMNYPELSKLLKTTDDAREAAREFFYVFEQGSEMGDRAGIAEEYLEKFSK